ncbi:hypothetical protein D9B83_06755 [Serratia marcescens]|nr:hypothetical protein D9B83_06755 [Serratia marcescens]
MVFLHAVPVLVRIAPDHATAPKATHEAGRRGGDSIACLPFCNMVVIGHLVLFYARINFICNFLERGRC